MLITLCFGWITLGKGRLVLSGKIRKLRSGNLRLGQVRLGSLRLALLGLSLGFVTSDQARIGKDREY